MYKKLAIIQITALKVVILLNLNFSQVLLYWAFSEICSNLGFFKG